MATTILQDSQPTPLHGRTSNSGLCTDASDQLYRPSQRLNPVLAPNLFAEFTALANKHGAANLGQGFPSFGSPEFLEPSVQDAIEGDKYVEMGRPAKLGNQYTRPGGEPHLAAVISRIYSSRMGRDLDGTKHVCTTIGAQEGIFTTLFAFTNPGDVVVGLTPCFDAVLKTTAVLGLDFRGVALRQPERGSLDPDTAVSSADWQIDLDALEAAITDETRVLMINSPSSPVGKVFSASELESIAAIVRRHPRLLVISDEVYERHVFGDAQHLHFASLDGMFDRTMTLFSAGKTFSCTGWRVGYVIAHEELTKALVASHAGMNFCAPTPLQAATASAFEHAAAHDYFSWLPRMMAKKRDELALVLAEVGLGVVLPEGGYFIVCDASVMFTAAGIDPDAPGIDERTALSARPDVQLCRWMTEHVGVTAIPVSPFFPPEQRHLANRLVRFAFCKDEATLALAAQRLREWKKSRQ